MANLADYYEENRIEAGCDEAGRGCLAGPVCAAAVILPPDFHHPLLDDSKKLSLKKREILRPIIEKEAIAWAVCFIDHKQIDKINILNASILGMQQAALRLKVKPESLLIDGNRFHKFEIPHHCFVKGDGRFKAIAAASVLAKTHRDELMMQLHERFPAYEWDKNRGYPTALHRKILIENGPSPYHRKSFHLKELDQIKIPFHD